MISEVRGIYEWKGLATCGPRGRLLVQRHLGLRNAWSGFSSYSHHDLGEVRLIDVTQVVVRRRCVVVRRRRSNLRASRGAGLEPRATDANVFERQVD